MSATGHRSPSARRRGTAPWRIALFGALASLASAAVDAQITFIGAGAQDAATSGSILPELPGAAVAGDFAVLIVAGRPTGTSLPSAPPGWTQRTPVLREVGANDLRLVTFYRVLAAGDADPSVAVPTGWTGGNAGMSGQIAVWRGVDGTAPFDANDATATSGANDEFTAPAITTVTGGAVVVSAVATSDDNALGLNSSQGFAARMSGTTYDTATGGDHSVGLADEVQAAAGAVAMPEWEQTASGSDDYWAAITFALRPFIPPAQRLSFSFEQSAWTGAAGQVIDDSPYGLHGTPVGAATTANATPALATNPGTCRYGVFNGPNTGTYVQVADNAALDIASELTVAAWIYLRGTPPDLYTIVSKDTNYEYHIDSQRRVYWWWNDSSGTVRSITTTTQLNLNQWYHVAVTYQANTQRIYINGTLQGTTGNHAGTLATNTAPLFVGRDLDFDTRIFNGYVDEVRVIADALTQAEVQALRNETHPCANTARFTITHNAFGIHCVAETVTVNVIDAITGTPLLNYNAPVQLDTQSGYGTWALVTGSGAFSDGTAGDGVATYTWPLGQSQATFTLYYPQGPPSIDVDVFQISNTGVRDNEPQGAIAFSPNGFSVTAAGLANPPGAITPFAANETAGTEFTLYLAAYGQTPSDPVCGIIESYSSPTAKNLRFWAQYVDPATGTRNVTINNVSAGTAEGSAVTVPVVFTNGQAVVVAKYKDVGRIRILMKDDTVNAALPTGIRGATTNFVVRPHSFLLSGIASGGSANPQASSAAGPVFVAAGAPFQMTVSARDAEGATTPNYGQEAMPETVRMDVQIVAPVGGANPAVSSGVGFGAFVNGVATGTDFTWNEVGIMQIVPGVGDSDYLLAGDVTGSASERIGRFVPSHFVVALNAPLFDTACSAGGPLDGFTYQGQSFNYLTAPVITARAVAIGGTTTTNYTGAFFKLTNTTLTGRSYTAGAPLATCGMPPDTCGVPPATIDPAIGNPSGGVATLTFSGGSGLSFVKGTPQAPFQAGVQLAIGVLDADGVAAVGAGPLGNPVTFGTLGGIPFDEGQWIRYGRIRIGTAVGSERVDLPVPMRAEYFESTALGFVTNLQDTCSNDVSLAFSGYTESLGTGDTCVRDTGAPGASGIGCMAPVPLALRYQEPPVTTGGDFNLRLGAPGAGNQGSVNITATVPDWLRFDWDAGAAGDEHPTGQATFGIFGGEQRQIYTREIY